MRISIFVEFELLENIVFSYKQSKASLFGTHSFGIAKKCTLNIVALLS